MDVPVFRVAEPRDKDKISAFLNHHWKPFNLINNERLFHHYFVHGDYLNFVLAEDRDGKLYGTLAFIYLDNSGSCFAHTLLKTIKSPYTMLGARMFEFFEAEFSCKRYFGMNMVPNTEGLHRLLGHTVGSMDHYYRLQDKREYKIAIVKDKRILPAKMENIRLVEIKIPEVLFSRFAVPKGRVPFKDHDYIIRRFYEYPAYQYQVYGIELPGVDTISSVVVCRVVPVEGEKVLKIVDFIGDEEQLALLSGEFQRLLDEGGYEYIEMYEYGVPSEIMAAAGFVKRNKDDPNIVPSYLEPLAQINTDYMVYHSANAENIRLFKADGDQDRPNTEE